MQSCAAPMRCRRRARANLEQTRPRQVPSGPRSWRAPRVRANPERTPPRQAPVGPRTWHTTAPGRSHHTPRRKSAKGCGGRVFACRGLSLNPTGDKHPRLRTVPVLTYSSYTILYPPSHPKAHHPCYHHTPTLRSLTTIMGDLATQPPT